MAVSQAHIIESLEQLCSNPNPDEFIYCFLDAYGFPKSTITRLRKGDTSRNVAVDGDAIALKKKLYFKAVAGGQDVGAVADDLKSTDLIARHDIRFVIVTDFQQLVSLDLTADERLEIPLSELDKNYGFFLPLAGYEKAIMFSEHPADLKASEKMGELFDLIRERNDLTTAEDIHALNVFLTRLLFCFYAEDTGIFDKGQLTKAIQSYTREDGSDLDEFFADLFTVMNLADDSPERKRLPAHFQAFKYVNGGLFFDDEPIPEFGPKARRILLACAALDWSEINPDIFGSMFQAVIDEEQRATFGQHYTSVSNIMKVIQPLFLDGLYAELDKAKGNKKRLQALLLRLQNIRIFDPACGSGNFLIIAYKELRKLEMEVIDALDAVSSQNVIYYSGIQLTQFYGIEIDDFACEIASLSLWLAEHQMNMEFKAKFGYSEAALPLRDGGNIVCGDSLRLDWFNVCPNGGGDEIYIIGNPPFSGSGRDRTAEQNESLAFVFSDFKTFKDLDFVAGWFWKGANYIAGSQAELALVSTSSVCQGEQVSLLWPSILDMGLHIHIAYQSFKWKNNAKNNAAVHVVIIGLSDAPTCRKLFELSEGAWHSKLVANISPYLLEGTNTVAFPRRRPLMPVTPFTNGSIAADGGHLVLTEGERELLINQEPSAAKWIRSYRGADDVLSGTTRYCLWLVDCEDDELAAMPLVRERIQRVREMRLASRKEQTQKKAETAHLFTEIRQPVSGSYLAIPRTSSENRDYIPIAYMDSSVIANNDLQIVPHATLYEFGILTSEMHNDWMRTVAGRLKSDYRYSATLVYNTFPWPAASAAKRQHIESLAEEILLIREDYPDKSLADLYGPDKMPKPLLDAHKALDRAVESLYRDAPFRDATERLEHLFARYERLIATETTKTSTKKGKRSTEEWLTC